MDLNHRVPGVAGELGVEIFKITVLLFMKKFSSLLVVLVVFLVVAQVGFLVAQLTSDAVEAPLTGTGLSGGGIKPDGVPAGTEVNGLVLAASWGGSSLTADAVEYAAQAMAGDGSLVVQVTGLAATNKSAWAGLMIRETRHAEARQISLLKRLDGRLEFAWRSEGGAPRESVVIPGAENVSWLRIVRRGDWFGGFGSADGVNWVLLEWRSLKLNPNVQAGVAVFGGETTELVQAQFDRLQFSADTAGALTAQPGTGAGLLGEYYADTNLQGNPIFTRIDPKLDFNWGFGTPLGFLRNGSFGVRWIGELEAQFSEDYTIYTASDDGVRVWLDEKLIIDDWSEHALREAQATVRLVARQRYKIRVEYYDQAEVAALKLSWSSPSTSKRVVPQTQLYCEVPGQGLPNLRVPPWAELTQDAVEPLAAPWAQCEVGAGKGGWGGHASGVTVVRGVGYNVGGRADAFHFVYQPLPTNVALVVRVLDLQSAQPWAKAGLMIREDLSAGAKHVSLFGTAGHGLIFNHRPRTDRETFDSTDLDRKSVV